jgi:hypothetical protein
MTIDRTLAGSLMTSTGQVGFQLRRAIYGQEISTYKEGDDDYKIVMRLQDSQRKQQSTVLNQPITFRNQMNGQMIQIPLATLSKTEDNYTFNQINHKAGNRVMTIYSNVKSGYNGQAITDKIKSELKSYKLPPKMTFGFSGEQEEQAKNFAFLIRNYDNYCASIQFYIENCGYFSNSSPKFFWCIFWVDIRQYELCYFDDHDGNYISCWCRCQEWYRVDGLFCAATG